MPDAFRNARQVRNAARSRFDARLAQVRGDLEARGLGGRVADKLGEEARATALLGLDVARESKGIIAATVTALALWTFRNPIIAWLDARLSAANPHNEEPDHD